MAAALEYVEPGNWKAVQTNFDTISANLRAAMPQARVTNAGNVAINNVTTTAVTFDTETYDVGGVHSVAANTSRLTAPITGLYNIVATVIYAAHATGLRITWLRINGAVNINGDERGNNGGGDAVIVSVPGHYRMLAGDYVEVTVFQNSGGALNILAGSSLMMYRVGGYANEGVAT